MKHFYAYVLEVYCFVKKNVFSKTTTKHSLNLQFIILFLLLGVYSTTKLNAQTITLTSSDKLIIDSNKSCNVNPEGPLATYVAYEFCNTTGVSTAPLEATFSISGTNFSLGGGQTATQSLGVLAPGECATLFWYIVYPCTEEVGTVTVELKDSSNNTILIENSTISTLKGPSANATGLLGGVGLTSSGVGQVTSYDVTYNFGSTPAGGLISFQPAGNIDFDAGCFQLIGLEIINSDIPDVVVGTIDEMVFYLNNAITGSGNKVVVKYYFKNKCVGVSTMASPYAYGVSGTQLKYTGNFDDPTYFGEFPITENNLSISKTVSTSIVTAAPNTITYTVAITNSGTSAASIDKITDVLPSPLQFNAIDISSDIQATNMSSMPVANATGTLEFIGGSEASTYPYTEFLIPGNSTVNLVYNVTVPSGITDGDYTNSATFTTGSYTSPSAEATFSFGPIPPVANNDSAVTEEDIPIALNIIANDTDSDGTIDATTVDLDPITPGKQSSITISGEGTYTVDSSGIVVFTPQTGYTGTSTINYTVRDNDGNISNEASITIQVGNVCTEDVAGESFDLKDGNSVTFNQPGTNYGFQFDIYTLDNSFNLNINGVDIAIQELEFQSAATSGINVQFKDGDQYETDTSGAIWQMTGTAAAPLVRVVISPSGVVSMFGSKTSGGSLSPLELINGNSFNTVAWNANSTNTVIASQAVVGGATNMSGYGSGKNIVSCIPSIEAVKTASITDNGDGVTGLGDTIIYTITVENTGNVSLSSISIVDTFTDAQGGVLSLDSGPAFVSSSLGSLEGALAIGEVANYTASYVLTQAAVDAGGLSNSVLASGESPSGTTVTDTSDDGDDLDGNTEDDPTETDLPANNPSINLEKTGVFTDTNGNGYADAGETITYSFTVTNTGNVTLTDITIDDPLVTVSGSIPSLAPGCVDSTTLSATYTITQADVDNGSVSNQATATGSSPGKTDDVSDVSDDGDDLDGNTEDDPTETDFPANNPSINLEKTGVFTDTNGNGYADAGETITYSFTVTNIGNVTVTGISITDALPGIVLTGGPIDLAPRASDSTTFSGSYTVTQSDIDAGSVSNTATATGKDPKNNDVSDVSDDGDDTDGNTEDDPTITNISSEGSISLLKEATFNDVNGNSFAEVGETITYNFTVTNTGNVTLTDITIDDPLVTVSGSIPSLAPGNSDSSTFSVVYTITQADISAGNVRNQAIVTGKDPSDNDVTDMSDDPTNTTNNDTDRDGDPDDETVTTFNVSVPDAIDDTAETKMEEPVTINIIDNDNNYGVGFENSSIEVIDSPAHGTVTIMPDGTVVYEPNAGVKYAGEDTFTYRVRDNNGNWTNIATVTINISGLFIPNVITPDGDGKNDTFEIIGLEQFDRAEVIIHNRWGNEVYKSYDYQNNFRGEGLNEGTYYYLISLGKNGQSSETYQGWIFIKR